MRYTLTFIYPPVYASITWRNQVCENDWAQNQFTVDDEGPLPLRCFDRLAHVPEFMS